MSLKRRIKYIKIYKRNLIRCIKVYRWKLLFSLLLLILAFSTIVLLDQQIASLYNLIVGDFLFFDSQKNWAVIITSITLLFVTLLSFPRISTLDTYSPAKKFDKVLTLLFLPVVYFYFRLNPTLFFFNTFSWDLLNTIAYSDVIFVGVYIGIISSLVYQHRKQKKEFEANPWEDTPIEKIDDDDLGYKEYAKTVVDEVILHDDFKNSFAIGVTGDWGAGKSSFFHLIKNQLPHNDEKIITLDFTPWQKLPSESLTKEFLETVIDELEERHIVGSRLFRKYLNRLYSAPQHSIKFWLTLFSRRNSIDELKDQINKYIRIAELKLVIFIDDLDRMNSKEIHETLLLMRNTANFNNTIFLVAYDRNYIEGQIQKETPKVNNSFLEKVFQLELNLPGYDKRMLQNLLMKEFKDRGLIEELDQDDVKSAVFGELSLTNETTLIFRHFINTPRDIKRFVNSFILNYKELRGDVFFEDFFKIEALRFSNPSAYNYFQQNKERFLDQNDFTVGANNQHLKRVNNNDDFAGKMRFNNTINTKQTLLYSDLIKKRGQLNLTRFEVNIITLILNEIFNEKTPHKKSSHKQIHNSIVWPSKTDRYFKYALSSSEISEIEFSKARESDFNSFKERIKEWIKEGKAQELAFKFQNIFGFDGKEDYEKVIKAILFFTDLENPDDKDVKLNLIENEIFLRIIKLALNNRGGFLFFKNEKVFSNTIHSIFKEYNSSLYLRGFLSWISNQPDHFKKTFPLSKETIETLLFKPLSDKINSLQEWDKSLIQDIYTCKIEEEGKKLFSRAKTKVRSFITSSDKVLISFLNWVVVEVQLDINKYIIHKFFFVVFENENDLIELYEDYNIKPLPQELIDFDKLYKLSNDKYEYPVEGFNPKKLNPDKSEGEVYSYAID